MNDKERQNKNQQPLQSNWDIIVNESKKTLAKLQKPPLDLTHSKDSKQKRNKTLKEKLEEKKQKLIESYIYNRSHPISPENYANYINKKNEYEKMLISYLRIKMTKKYISDTKIIGETLEESIDKKAKEIEATLLNSISDISKGAVEKRRKRLLLEGEKELRDTYLKLTGRINVGIYSEFINCFVKEQISLEQIKINAIDRNNVYKKDTDNLLTNKILKHSIAVATTIGLKSDSKNKRATTKGKSSSSSSISSKTSASNQILEIAPSLKEDYERELEANIKNTMDWIIEEYSKINSLNERVMEILPSVTEIISSVIDITRKKLKIGNKIDRQAPRTANFSNVSKKLDTNESEKYSVVEVFSALGGDSSRTKKAMSIVPELDREFGLLPASDGNITSQYGEVGDFANAYSEKISKWPEVAHAYIFELARKWANLGLIHSEIITDEHIYTLLEKTTIKYIPSAFIYMLSRQSLALFPKLDTIK